MEANKKTTPNPWLQIPWQDYENHMQEVGQLQALSEITRESLQEYQPRSFALLGCATGNGLEHVNPVVTSGIYAVDINPEFLTLTNQRFAPSLPDLQTRCMDVEKQKPDFSGINLMFCGLLLEYVNPEITLQNIVPTLAPGGTLIMILQQSTQDNFVSKTRYKSLESLSSIAQVTQENEIHALCLQLNLHLHNRRILPLQNSKSFCILHYRKS